MKCPYCGNLEVNALEVKETSTVYECSNENCKEQFEYEADK